MSKVVRALRIVWQVISVVIVLSTLLVGARAMFWPPAGPSAPVVVPATQTAVAVATRTALQRSP